MGLYNFGLSYLETARAASKVSSQFTFTDPIEFLCAHGLELIFKADLCRTRELETVRQKFGHSLPKLRDALSGEFVLQFPITSELGSVVDYLAIGHSGPNWRNRYIVTGVRQHLTPSQILSPLAVFDTNNRSWLTGHFKKAQS